MVLMATGRAVGVAAAVTRVSTSIVGHSKNTSVEAGAICLVSTGNNRGNAWVNASQPSESPPGIGRNAQAGKLAKAPPPGSSGPCSPDQWGDAGPELPAATESFGGTTLAMTKDTRSLDWSLLVSPFWWV